MHFHIETGDGVELTPAAREALETLVSELSGTEVEGYRLGLNIWDCDDYFRPSCAPDNCILNNCQPLTTTPSCLAHSHCRISV